MPPTNPKPRLEPGYEFAEDGPRLRTDEEADRRRFAGLGSDVVRTIAAGGPGRDNVGTSYQAAAIRELERRRRDSAS